MRRRLDQELVRRKLLPSRAQAQAAIAEGRVTVGGAQAKTPARLVAAAEAVRVSASDRQYVSRGGLKLAAALDAFAIDPTGRRGLDVGASTGGFTDCLLQRGAERVVAVDVGRNQIAWSLRTDARVEVHEQRNIRSVHRGEFGEAFDLIVADLAFISLTAVAGNLLELATADADLVLLIKPQFEAGRTRIGRGGVIRDPQIRADIVSEVAAKLHQLGLGIVDMVTSPITGADGNVEFLAFAHPSATPMSDSDIRTHAAGAGPSIGENEES